MYVAAWTDPRRERALATFGSRRISRRSPGKENVMNEIVQGTLAGVEEIGDGTLH